MSEICIKGSNLLECYVQVKRSKSLEKKGKKDQADAIMQEIQERKSDYSWVEIDLDIVKESQFSEIIK